MSEWFREYFDDVDTCGSTTGSRGTATMSWSVGDNPPARGKEEVAGNIGYFWSTIDGLKHNIVHSYEMDGTTILETNVDYHRKDGTTGLRCRAQRCCTHGDLVDALRVYIDLAPVFAPAE